jgi:hypothetical protein
MVSVQLFEFLQSMQRNMKAFQPLAAVMLRNLSIVLKVKVMQQEPSYVSQWNHNSWRFA